MGSILRSQTPPAAHAVEAPCWLAAFSDALAPYPLRDLLQTYLLALGVGPATPTGAPDATGLSELNRIYHWTDFCLSCWTRELDTQLTRLPRGGSANLSKAYASLLSERNALNSVRTELKRMHDQHAHWPALSDGIDSAPMPFPPDGWRGEVRHFSHAA